ncbi:hypothetical protein V8G54_005153 [Vigna mungo]|uniref:Uncharacterized protein n=1 Tax=Vigna mungo TaxID=3915 RepID=A0AAQ3PI44_VIGMU
MSCNAMIDSHLVNQSKNYINNENALSTGIINIEASIKCIIHKTVERKDSLPVLLKSIQFFLSLFSEFFSFFYCLFYSINLCITLALVFPVNTSLSFQPLFQNIIHNCIQ